MRDQLEPLVATNKTMANIQSVLRKALDDAIEDELIDVNPLANWTFSKVEPPSENDDIDPFSKDEQAVILEASPDGQGRNFIEFMFWSGMRTSEAVAFDWPDIDWIRGVVMVTRAITQHSKTAESTKTAAGRREIKLLEPAMAALKRKKTAHMAQGRGSLPESKDRRTLDGRPGHQEDAMDADTEALRRAIPISIPDPPHLRQHDAVRRRASNVGGQADGPQGLDNDCPSLRPLDA